MLTSHTMYTILLVICLPGHVDTQQQAPETNTDSTANKCTFPQDVQIVSQWAFLIINVIIALSIYLITLLVVTCAMFNPRCKKMWARRKSTKPKAPSTISSSISSSTSSSSSSDEFVVPTVISNPKSPAPRKMSILKPSGVKSKPAEGEPKKQTHFANIDEEGKPANSLFENIMKLALMRKTNNNDAASSEHSDNSWDTFKLSTSDSSSTSDGSSTTTTTTSSGSGGSGGSGGSRRTGASSNETGGSKRRGSEYSTLSKKSNRSVGRFERWMNTAQEYVDKYLR